MSFVPTDRRRRSSSAVESGDSAPTWSPDGTRLAFSSDRWRPASDADHSSIGIVNADGTCPGEQRHDSWRRRQRRHPGRARARHDPRRSRRRRVEGGRGRDRIFGGAGTRPPRRRPGSDRLSGGAGNDTFFAWDGYRDRVDGGPGRDDAYLADPFDVITSARTETSPPPTSTEPELAGRIAAFLAGFAG